MRARYVFLLILVHVVFAPLWARGFENGDREISFRLTYSSLDSGTFNNVRLGKQEDLTLGFSFGYLLNRGSEIGLHVSYTRTDFSESDIIEDSESDGSILGAFFQYNVPTGGSAMPFFGINVGKPGGGLAEAYDWVYGVDLGVKVYPFDHGGFLFGLEYQAFQGTDRVETIDGQDRRVSAPSGTGVGAVAALLLRF